MIDKTLALRTARARSIAGCDRWGFTLVETLIVLGIIAVLIGLLLPIAMAARRSSQTTMCSSNLRQVGQAFTMYANDANGHFPPNSGEIGQFWYQTDKIGKYLPSPVAMPDNTVAGGVLVCPQDAEGAIRSYSMNVFASSVVGSVVRKAVTADPPKAGQLWTSTTSQSTSVILMAESWSELAQPEGSPTPVGYAAQAILGFVGQPGRRFGTKPGIGWKGGRFGVRASQIAFNRHRTGADNSRKVEDPIGRANFVFVDGHVESLATGELADFETGKSRYRALWSAIDSQLEGPLVPR